MKKFSFRLQRVLDLRTIQEKAKLSSLGQERFRLEEEKRKLDLFKQEAKEQLEQMMLEQQTAFHTWVRQANYHYLNRVQRVVDYQARTVNSQQGNVEQARDSYMDAHRDTQSIEKIHDKRLQEWKTESSREEGKLLDEFSARRHVTGGDR